jgi:predicted neuraminidase
MLRAILPLLPLLALSTLAAAQPAVESELIFPLQPQHNHSSSIVEFPSGELFAVWFHGSGERRADAVRVMGARRPAGSKTWSEPFTVADYPGFPDTNCTLFLDRHNRVWLFWMTFLANEVETTVLNYRVSSTYEGLGGAPVWQRQELLLLHHDLDRFAAKVREAAAPLLPHATPERAAYLLDLMRNAADKYRSRTGWMVRTHPVQLPSGRMLVGLYSDLYDFSLVALSDDDGLTWRPSDPIVGFGNVQPGFVRKRDGTLVAYMRDNGLAPKRIPRAESHDEGETWGPVTDTAFPNPGASVEPITLADGRWLLVYNDLEEGRHSLAVSLSADEGATWSPPRHLDRSAPGAGSFHYPSVIQARDGAIHVTYSYFVEGGKSIKHARFPLAWLPAPRSGP